jgi:solute carrier family 35 protein E1
VANTAKRVIIIVGTAIVFGESMEFMKMVGCAIAIGGVFLYSLMEDGKAHKH